MKEWSHLKGGFYLGLLSIIAFLIYKPLGVSTSYVLTDGMILNAISPEFVANNEYFQKYAGNFNISPGWLLTVGMIIGGFIGSKLFSVKTENGSKGNHVPEMWAERFGESKWKRYAGAFIGGFLLLYGARLADGCTSGHVISGISQMAVSSLLFGAAVFASGIPTAKLLYRKGRK